jgi:O-antigen/teichoic acid export membrane protein
VTLVKSFRLYGLFFVVCILAISNTLFLCFLSKYTLRFKFQLKGILELIKYGVPLLLLSVLNMILKTIDRIMIAKMLGLTFVGYYSLAIMGRNYATGISSHLGVVSIPKILGEYGRRENIDDIKKFVIVPAKTIAYLMAPFLALMFFVAPLFVEKVLPQYIPGILSLQILLISVFFNACISQTTQFIIAINKKEKLVIFSMFAIVLNIILNYIFIKIGYGIYGVAWGTSLTSFFIFLTIQYYAMAQFDKFKKIVSFFIILLIPFVYILCSVLLIELLICMQNLYMETLFKMMILAIIAIPLFIYIDKDTGVLKSIFKIIRLKLKF